MKIFFSIIILFYCNISTAKSIFESEFHQISFVSSDVLKEKNKIINNIKKISLEKILDNILTVNSYDNYFSKLSEDTINFFIKNIIIENEKIINNYYFSNIKINFDKKKIIQDIKSNNLSYVEYIPNKILTIIAEKDKINKKSLSKNNTYYNYLLKNNDKFNFYFLPNLDINDRFILSDKDIIDLNYLNIIKLKKKYNYENAIIIISNKTYEYYVYKIYLSIDDKFFKVNEFSTKNRNFNDFFEISQKNILDIWKQHNSVSFQNLSEINCYINYYNLLELKKIKELIDRISLIKKIQLINVELKSNRYKIIFYGNHKHLEYLFKNNQLKIMIKDNNCQITLI